MTLGRLRDLLDVYGASATRWPAEERAAALALLGESSEARALQAVAARLDAALDLVPALQPSPDLVARVLAEAPGVHPRFRRRRALRRRLMAAALPIAAAAGAVLWLVSGREITPTEPVQYAIEDLGRYTTPTDLLLSPPGLDLSRTLPTMGCDASGLGCPDLDPTVDEQSSFHLIGGSYV